MPDFGKNWFNGNRFASAVLDGWQFTGISQFVSGPPLQAYRINFGLQGSVIGPDGTTTVPLSQRRILGTSSSSIQPLLTCDPRSGLSDGQYINLSCLAAPQLLSNGTWRVGPNILPYLRGPAFYNNDLSVFKTWNVTEKRRVQFRASAFNLFNHPLRSLTDANLVLNVDRGQPTQQTKNLFGRFTDNKVGRRQIQLALKFFF